MYNFFFPYLQIKKFMCNLNLYANFLFFNHLFLICKKYVKRQKNYYCPICIKSGMYLFCIWPMVQALGLLQPLTPF